MKLLLAEILCHYNAFHEIHTLAAEDIKRNNNKKTPTHQKNTKSWMSDSYVTKPKKYQQNVQVLLLLHPFLPMCTHGNSTYKMYTYFQIINIIAYTFS